MKTEKLTDRWGLWLSTFVVLFITFLEPSYAALQAPLKTSSLVLDAPFSEVSVTVKGQTKSLQNGRPMALGKGWQELRLSAPGYSTRTLRFLLPEGTQIKRSFDLSKLRHPQESVSWTSTDRLVKSSERSQKATVCSWFHKQVKVSALCLRQHWADEFAFAEAPLFDPEDMRSLQEQKLQSTYRVLLSRRGKDDAETTEAFEDFYTAHAQLPAAFLLLAQHSLLRGDCPRVHSIFADAQQTLSDLHPFMFYKALCAELEGQNDLARQLLKNTLETPSKNESSYLRYHLGRLWLTEKPEEALQQANICLKKAADSIPCQELGQMASALLQKKFKTSPVDLEEASFKTLLSLEAALKEKRYESAFTTLSYLLNSYPQAMEFYLLLGWTDAAEQLPLDPHFIEQKLEQSVSLGGSSLDTIVDALEKRGLTRLLPPVYKNKLRNHPDDPNLWLRLVRAYDKAQQCKLALASIEEGAHVLPKFNASLLETKSSCHHQLGQWKEALDAYDKLIEISPPSWALQQNRAQILESLKKYPEALTAYQQALALQPPAEIRQGIEIRIQVLEDRSQRSSKPLKPR